MSLYSYSRPSGVIQNIFNTDDEDFLDMKEKNISSERYQDILEGNGPKGNFDRDHLKAIHEHLFQDVYPWAGRMRDETFTIDGHHYEIVDQFTKNGRGFLPPQFFASGFANMQEPISDLHSLKAAPLDEFAERVGDSLGRLNYIHPFREGNGRSQRAFIAMLGQECGRKFRFAHITKATNDLVALQVLDNPNSRAYTNLMLDTLDPNRMKQLASAINNLEKNGHDTEKIYLRTGMVGEFISGPVAVLGDNSSGVFHKAQMVIVSNSDLPANISGDISLQVKTNLSQEAVDQRDLSNDRAPGNDDDGMER